MLILLEILQKIIQHTVLIYKIYFIKQLRKFSRIKKFLDIHESTSHQGKVYGYVSDLSHAFFYRARDMIYHNDILLFTIIGMIFVCINISSLIVIDAMLHSSYNSNTVLIITSLRSILQLLYKSSPPDGRFGPWFKKFNHWSLPSQKETFFSGHTTIVVLALFFYKNAHFTLYYISETLIRNILIFNVIYIISCLIILRIHYIIDIYAAIVTCMLCHNWMNSL